MGHGQSPGNPQASRCFCLSPVGTEMCSILTLVGVGAGIKSPFISFFGCRVKTVQGQFHRVQLDQKKTLTAIFNQNSFFLNKMQLAKTPEIDPQPF